MDFQIVIQEINKREIQIKDLNDKIKRLDEIIKKLNNENNLLVNENLELKNINKNLLFRNESFMKDEREFSLSSDNGNSNNDSRNEKSKTYSEVLNTRSNMDIKNEIMNIKHFNGNNIDKELKYNNNLTNNIKNGIPLIFKICFMDKTIIWEHKYDVSKHINSFSILLFKLEDKQKYDLKIKENEQKYENLIKDIENKYKNKIDEMLKKYDEKFNESDKKLNDIKKLILKEENIEELKIIGTKKEEKINKENFKKPKGKSNWADEVGSDDNDNNQNDNNNLNIKDNDDKKLRDDKEYYQIIYLKYDIGKLYFKLKRDDKDEKDENNYILLNYKGVKLSYNVKDKIKFVKIKLIFPEIHLK